MEPLYIVWFIAVTLFVILVWKREREPSESYDFMCKCGNFDRCPHCNRWRML